ncbi:hypothetical protein BKA66DRAFT_412844 [Pyrenochaeta sp. MPI-SDFR-AT-0127]|nr:hypothetical protein BKA66DRAFT_412844 [Pyrenochaeta sp. MPI-SDFR-AT-0127]
MAATDLHDHLRPRLLPTSPPPSPTSTRRRHKKKLDPFEKLALTPIPSPPESPTNGPIDDESLLTKIILTPVLFTSFILSLFFVNYRNRARRTNAHSSHSFLAHFYPSTWLDPEPYQDSSNPSRDGSGSGGRLEPHDAIGPRKGEYSPGGKKKSKSWYLNKKIRKVAKMEIGDAFQLRSRIMAGMVIVLVLSSAALCMGLKWLLVSLSESRLSSKT